MRNPNDQLLSYVKYILITSLSGNKKMLLFLLLVGLERSIKNYINKIKSTKTCTSQLKQSLQN